MDYVVPSQEGVTEDEVINAAYSNRNYAAFFRSSFDLHFKDVIVWVDFKPVIVNKQKYTFEFFFVCTAYLIHTIHLDVPLALQETTEEVSGDNIWDH